MINRRNFLRLFAMLGFSGGTFRASVEAVTPQSPLLDPPDDADWDWWRELPRTPVVMSADRTTGCRCRAARLRREVTIFYEGGSEPGKGRKISPLGVFQAEGYSGTYVHAFCHVRSAERTFRIERIAAVV